MKHEDKHHCETPLFIFLTSMRTNFSSFSRILLIGFPLEEYHQIQTILIENGHEVLVTPLRTESLDHDQLDLIILKASVSNPNLQALIQQIRHPQIPSFIPILLVTSGDRWEFQEIDATDLIPTPIQPDFLLDRVQVLLQWKQRIDALIQRHQQQEEFVAALVHDLRSPLSATNQVLRQILQGRFGHTLLELQDVLEHIVNNNQILIQIVETLLNTYQSEMGSPLANFVPINCVELSQQVVNEMTPLAHQKGLSLTLQVEAPRDSMISVRGDRLALYRLLTNLISNAIQYTDRGAIVVRLTSVSSPDASGSGQVMIEVEDTGVGIPAENLGTIFDRFQRRGAHPQGYGLGLYLCDQIVKAHQGTMTVRSEQGRGSAFTIYLPGLTIE